MTKQEQTALVNLDGEVWKPVVGFEMSYCVSNYARVKMLAKIVGEGVRGTHFVKEHLIAVHINGDGRPFVHLTIGSKGRKRFLEDVVADAFIPNPMSYRCIIHKNGDIADCGVSNLERVAYELPMEPGEEWRDVVGYEGLYKISNHGRVFSLITETKGPRVMKKKRPGLLSPQLSVRNGKQYITVRFGNKHHYLHRLIAEAFIPNPNNHNEIDHIDRDGTNNSISNLRWVNHKMNQNNENTRRVMSVSQKGTKRPERNVPVVKLKYGKFVKYYESIRSVIIDGHSPSGVANCLCGRAKSHQGFTWMRLSDYLKK